MKMLRKLVRLTRHLKWFRFGLRDRLARFIDKPEDAHGSFVVDFYGLNYSGKFDNFIDWSVYYFGAYAEKELLFFSDVLRGRINSVVLDIGANIGHHSLYLSTVAKVVHAFEPYEKVLVSFREKIEVNGIDNIYIHPYAMGSKDETLSFYAPGDCNMGTGSFVGNDKAGSEINLEVRHADQVISNLALDKIDLIKIDVEGFEVSVLRGLKSTLDEFRPVVFFEFSLNERNISSNVIDLFPPGYEFYEFIAHLPLLGVFQDRSYCLRQIKGRMRDGNVVAIHKQDVFMHLFNRFC